MKTVTVKCDKCDGRGFYRAPCSEDIKTGVSGLAKFCAACDGRGTRSMEVAS